ncbi:MAG: hypothetical protein ACTSXU_08490 [Promethearchaeota archaeon]
MKILVIGNISAGKTTLISKLEKITKCPIFSIDNMRKTCGDGTIAGEYLAYHHFLRKCASTEDIFLEFSGAGIHKHAVRLALKEARMPVLLVLVLTSVETCLKRAKTFNIENTPYSQWGIEIDKVIMKIDKELQHDQETGFWKGIDSLQIIKIKSISETTIKKIIERAT